MAKKNTTSGQILIGLICSWFMMVGCKEEFDQQPLKYQYLWTFTSNCGGYIIGAVPNTFSPDQDGLNDEWQVFLSDHFNNDSCNGVPVPIGTGIKSFHVEVRDMHNELYFSGTDINAKWNGTNGNSRFPVSSGQYLWKFRLEDLDGVVHEEHGTVNVMM